MSSPRDVRQAAVRDRLTHAEQRLSRRYPEVAHRDHGGAVDDARWAAYVDELDRGLSELDLEIARAAEAQDPAIGTREAITVHASAMELAGWRLRFTFDRNSSGAVTERALAAAEAAVKSHRSGSDAADRPSADTVVAAVDDVRRTAT
jgi:hypothetical protein